EALNFDWNQVRAFLATAEEGSLSAAARVLALTQPTVSRPVAALEDALGVVLFERTSRRLVVTEAGRQVLAHVRAMADAASQVSLTATGQSTTVSGLVSVTATNGFATRYLPDILKDLRDKEPGICVSILTSNSVMDLTQREADISIRHARPQQDELIGTLVGEMSAQFYASADLLDRYGRPKNLEELSRLPFVGFTTPEQVVAFLQGLGLSVREEGIAASTASGTLALELVRAGLGVSILTMDVAAGSPELELALPSFEPMPLPIWLVAHRELHTSRRIRLVFDHLAAALRKEFASA
ncbi:MAG: LysR family transcriptional regulator, partial [Pseudomonadota bacterium]